MLQEQVETDLLLLEAVSNVTLGLFRMPHLGRQTLSIAITVGKRDMLPQGVMCQAVGMLDMHLGMAIKDSLTFRV